MLYFSVLIIGVAGSEIDAAQPGQMICKKAGSWSIRICPQSAEDATLEALYHRYVRAFVGKIVGVNFLTARILLASDLNSKIPVVVEPGNINAILSGRGNNEFAELEYLPTKNNVEDGNVVYTSGIDGIISPAIPIGKVLIKEDKKFVEFFADYNQLKFVKINK